ncbi:MAG: YIP1 family protein [Candidatus Melainabacteria bacterium]|nr:YIP1 family protein [Candidatus Melainabacteria bacterium]OPZ89354.1 MAG: hypothetical protein BWY75_01197 [bacterium ADurb.Bin425]
MEKQTPDFEEAKEEKQPAQTEAGEAEFGEKTLAESEPFELEQAFRQVIKNTEEEPESSKTKTEASRDYSNSFNLFADIFYGVLVAPRQTMLILSDQRKFPPSAINMSMAIFFVTLALSMTAWLRFKPQAALASAGAGLTFTISGLLNWISISVVLYYLNIFLRGKLKFANALIACAWAFLPFLFFPPVLCFKKALGPAFPLLASFPATWFLILLFITFQSALRTTTFKLSLILIVLPPLLFGVYTFWLFLAFGLTAIQLLSR